MSLPASYSYLLTTSGLRRPLGLALALVLLTVGTVVAQQMPLALVEGSQYTRRTIDAQGREEACQQLDVSRLAAEGTELVATLTVSPCEVGTTGDSARGTIRCRMEDAGMVMSAVVLLDPEGRSVSLRTMGDAVLYPGPPTEPAELPSVSLDAVVESGTIGFLGGRSRIDLTERRAAPDSAGDPPEGLAGSYTVTEAVRLRAYVLGIRVKDRRYRAEHRLRPDGRLLFQVLTASDGTTITLERTG